MFMFVCFRGGEQCPCRLCCALSGMSPALATGLAVMEYEQAGNLYLVIDIVRKIIEKAIKCYRLYNTDWKEGGYKHKSTLIIAVFYCIIFGECF